MQRWRSCYPFLSKRTVIAGIAVLLVLTSGISFWLTHEIQIAAQHVQATATAFTRKSIAQTHVAGTATSQAINQASTQAAQDSMTSATAIASLNPDPSFQTLVLNDPLTSNSGSWDDKDHGPMILSGACTFGSDGYDISSNGSIFSPICLLRNHPFTDFVSSVQMKILKGTCGILFFRMPNDNTAGGYSLKVCQNGHYSFLNQQNTASDAIQQGFGQTNTVAVAMRGSSIDLYINKEQVLHSTDAKWLNGGDIGMGVYGDFMNGTTGEAIYSNLYVWTP